jgi:hypothetical protein
MTAKAGLISIIAGEDLDYRGSLARHTGNARESHAWQGRHGYVRRRSSRWVNPQRLLRVCITCFNFAKVDR